MKLRYKILFIICALSASVYAQTLEQARSMFTKGEYAQAKPVFERYVKSQPSNTNYNYWYGVCLLKTDEAEQAIPHLELAAKKKVQNAPFYLGQAYNETYRFDEAVAAYEEFIEGQLKRKQSTAEADSLLEKSKINARMIKGVEEVCVIDSFVVDKAGFLNAYKISEESGKIYTYNEFFNQQGDNEGTVYETELGNKVYYSKTGDHGSLAIYSTNKLLDEWSKGVELPGSINTGGDANYPFVLTDGVTIYYASDNEHSMGGYDIFVTRYNSGSDTYLAPENVGMPFNSPYNDYMYVIDEYNNLGWFATDRHQPADTVCIYVFVPNTSRQAYNYEAMDPKKIRSLARLESIEDTWKNEADVEQAKNRLDAAINQPAKERKVVDFEFIVNDQYTYYQLSDFRSARAKELFARYRRMESDYKAQSDKLSSQRDAYAKANNAGKQRMAPALLDLEKRVGEMGTQLDTLRVGVRNEEIKTFK